MRLIDADAYIEKLADVPMVQEAIRKSFDSMPTIDERKKGEWVEKHVYSDEEGGIEEWQSCCCSKCGRYDTRPYMYFFQEPHFCSWCGADMRGEEEK